MFVYTHTVQRRCLIKKKKWIDLCDISIYPIYLILADVRRFVRCRLIQTANFLFNALPLNLSHQLAFHQYDLTALFSHAKSLNPQKVDTMLTEADRRFIHKINNPRQASRIELLIPTLTFLFSCVISRKLSPALVVIAFILSSLPWVFLFFSFLLPITDG